VPVICSANAGASDIIRDGVDGFVVPAGDPAALADRLRLLHGDEVRCVAMGAAAQKRAAEFTWQRYGERILARYRAIWEERNRR